MEDEPAGPTRYVAYVKRAKAEEVEAGLRTLIGEYEEKGSHLGRKVYQKVHMAKGASKGKSPLDVLLYYWDDRDGDTYEGWWFGNKLGGSQVWAHCKERGPRPPVSGWKVPWNGYVRPDFALVPKEEKLQRDMKTRLLSLIEEVAQAESDADLALDQVLNSMGLGKGQEAIAALPIRVLLEAEGQLAPQVKSISDLERKVADAHRAALASESKTAADTERNLRELGSRIRNKKEKLSTEYAKAKTLRQKGEHDQTQEAAEEQDTHAIDNFLPDAETKANAAEDLAEVAQITFDGIAVLAESDPSAVILALAETERAAKKAQVALSEARMYVNAKVSDAKSFAPKAKDRATTELEKRQKQLESVQTKLKPLLDVRKDWLRKKEVQKRVAEVENEVVLAEVDIDKAEEAMLLMNADPSKDTLENASKATEVASEHVEAAIKGYEDKRAEASEEDRVQLEKRLAARGKLAEARLKQLRARMKEGTERITAEGFLKEGEEKLQAVLDSLAALDDATTVAMGALVAVPGSEDGSGASAEDVRTWEAQVKAPEGAAAAASTACSMAKMFMNMKQLEVKRFTPAIAESTIKGLQELQAKLDTWTKRINDLRGSAAKLRREVLRKEVEIRVAKAISLAEEVREAAAIFAADGAIPAHLEPEEAREAAARASVKERAAAEAIQDARKLIVARQVEAKDVAEEASALTKLNVQIQKAQASVADLRKRWGSVEQHLAARRILNEVEAKLKETEAKVTLVLNAVAELPEEPLSNPKEGLAAEAISKAEGAEAASVKEVEIKSREAQLSVRSMIRMLESQTRMAAFARESLGALEPRSKEIQERLDTASEAIKERTERGFVRGLLREAHEKARECRERFAEASEAEKALKDATDDDAERAKRTVAFEKAVQLAQAAASTVKTTVAMKRLAAKRLSERGASAAGEALEELQRGVDAAGAKLTELRARSTEAKMALLRKAASASKA